MSDSESKLVNYLLSKKFRVIEHCVSEEGTYCDDKGQEFEVLKMLQLDRNSDLSELLNAVKQFLKKNIEAKHITTFIDERLDTWSSHYDRDNFMVVANCYPVYKTAEGRSIDYIVLEINGMNHQDYRRWRVEYFGGEAIEPFGGESVGQDDDPKLWLQSILRGPFKFFDGPLGSLVREARGLLPDSRIICSCLVLDTTMFFLEREISSILARQGFALTAFDSSFLGAGKIHLAFGEEHLRVEVSITPLRELDAHFVFAFQF
ncbi:hypothetical protein H6775_03935 [Candidatus Nomurabacteria bacterium]|nr:hypothetical protein [Candidatus Nomurabacteria bacterium]